VTSASRAMRVGMCLGALLFFTSRADGSGLPLGFVYLHDVAPDIVQDIRYASLDNFTGAKVPGYKAGECILKEPVAEALRRVQAELDRQSLGLKVYDCYRPARATRAFMKWMDAKSASGATKRYHPRIDKKSLRALGYISARSSHSRGVAVDATLVRLPTPNQQAFDPAATYSDCTAAASDRSPDNSIDMGTGFDCFDVMSHAGFVLSPMYGSPRNLLRDVMRRHGFENYRREWWHFTFMIESTRGPALDFVIEQRPH
jgi:zinc D-Ala-D-Ala dipeptidase